MKISVYIAISANGMISNSRNVPDWLSPEYGQGLISVCREKKAVIMGKTTYNILAPDYLPLQKEGSTVVLTTDKQAKSDNPTVVFTRSQVTEITQMLSEKGHTDAVIIGGATIISEFINAGLVDDIYFVMEPVLFGIGLQLFKSSELELKLNLVDVEKLNDNTIKIHYKIKK